MVQQPYIYIYIYIYIIGSLGTKALQYESFEGKGIGKLLR